MSISKVDRSSGQARGIAFLQSGDCFSQLFRTKHAIARGRRRKAKNFN